MLHRCESVRPWALAFTFGTIAAACGAEPTVDADSVFCAGDACDSRTTAATSPKPQEVHGAVVASYPALGKAFVPVPDVSVWVTNAATGIVSATVKTDLAGRYIVPPQPQGDYVLCWSKSGWLSSCGKRFSIGLTVTFPGLTARLGRVDRACAG